MGTYHMPFALKIPRRISVNSFFLGLSSHRYISEDNKMKSIFVALACLACIYATRASEQTEYCPALSDTGPCYCRHGFYYDVTGTRVSCSGINSTEVLYEEIQKFQGYKIDLLIFERFDVPYFPAGLFSGTSVKKMVVTMSKVDNLYSVDQYKPSPFEGLGDSLEEINVMMTQGASNWYWPDMSNLKKLKRIEFGFSPLNWVGHVFAEIGDGSLESIVVQYSSVYRVHPQAFPSLANLKEVSLRGNFLPYMVRTMFADPAPQLKTIDLRANLLFNLPENMFSNMPALQFVDLSKNKFVEFQEVVFTPIWNTVPNMYLADNPLNCDCNLLWLYEKIASGSVPRYNDFYFLTCKSKEQGAVIPIKNAGNDVKCQ